MEPAGDLHPDMEANTSSGSGDEVLRRYMTSGGANGDACRCPKKGRPILERVDLMETFFAGVHRQI